MTDRPRPGLARTNPAPRRALPRVTPLGAGAAANRAAYSAAEGTEPVEGSEATGRDLLIPNGNSTDTSSGTAGHKGGRRKGRSSGTVPTIAELMPPSRPAPTVGNAAERSAGKADKSENADKPEKAGKAVTIEITLPKALRKRLKTKAAELGLSPEAAIRQLLEVWVDG